MVAMMDVGTQSSAHIITIEQSNARDDSITIYERHITCVVKMQHCRMDLIVKNVQITLGSYPSSRNSRGTCVKSPEHTPHHDTSTRTLVELMWSM
ncbi:hypothetical protein AVEN_90228-1 [Araneus ventricosus]|uniref:Uncharacterized protein n=1 Tax=Araneus ventricosus TaxID=182803 RepID=A0A4Y2W1F6_ARAVE|nr:hypothetical protein AVEN_251088-1 [Araneus ventricosus]GBO31543.1 hypothetical protein AVEN_90228-1 [Araneus ventricosus]